MLKSGHAPSCVGSPALSTVNGDLTTRTFRFLFRFVRPALGVRVGKLLIPLWSDVFKFKQASKQASSDFKFKCERYMYHTRTGATGHLFPPVQNRIPTHTPFKS